jgi:hypothetical protein
VAVNFVWTKILFQPTRICLKMVKSIFLGSEFWATTVATHSGYGVYYSTHSESLHWLDTGDRRLELLAQMRWDTLISSYRLP